MTVAFTNQASTTLAGGITALSTSLSLAVTTGANFPATSGNAWFYLTLVDQLTNWTKYEIVKVTTRSSDTCSVIVRAQDGTTAQAWPSGTYVQLRLTAGTFADLTVQYANNADNLSNLASAATSRTNLGLGTMAVQNATAVAITGGTIAGATLTGSAFNGTVGATTPSTIAATTISASGVITSTLATGTAPFAITSTTVVGNLNVSQLLGATWTAPGAIGSVTPSSGAFTTLSASGAVSGAGFTAYLASPPAIGGGVAAAGTFAALNATTIRAVTSINMRGLDNASATNSGFGEGVLAANAGGTGNTAAGYRSLAANTTGIGNSGLGVDTLRLNTSGYENTAVGYGALGANRLGYYNIAIGSMALDSSETSVGDIAIGVSALGNTGAAVTAGGFIIGIFYTIKTAGTTVFTAIGAADNNPGTVFLCTGVGTGTGTATANFGYNVGIGVSSLVSNISGIGNAAIGYTASYNSTIANYNVAIGHQPMYFNVSGEKNIAIGRNAFNALGPLATAGAFVVGVSYTIVSIGTTDFTLIGAALNNVNVVFTATGVGVGTGTASPNASNNIGIGDSVGAALIRGTNNTLVGVSSNTTSANQTNATAIGYQATATADNQVLLGNSSVTTTVLRGQVTAPSVTHTITRKTGNYTVLATDTTILCDTSGAGFTVTLTASPADGHVVNIKKITTDANVLTIGRNGKNIEGAAADLTTALTTRPNFQLQYELANTTWWLL